MAPKKQYSLLVRSQTAQALDDLRHIWERLNDLRDDLGGDDDLGPVIDPYLDLIADLIDKIDRQGELAQAN